MSSYSTDVIVDYVLWPIYYYGKDVEIICMVFILGVCLESMYRVCCVVCLCMYA